jgi:hypothetical protein
MMKRLTTLGAMMIASTLAACPAHPQTSTDTARKTTKRPVRKATVRKESAMEVELRLLREKLDAQQAQIDAMKQQLAAREQQVTTAQQSATEAQTQAVTAATAATQATTAATAAQTKRR